jgi:pimeloyl-ACP methyl ester carboxylesterase
VAIRPFVISIASEEIQDLRERLRNARWPQAMPGVGWDMGMDTEYLRILGTYWLEQFDWRTIEAKLNSVPQFVADTDRGPIHFVHLRGTGPSPTPIVLTHGWPSTFAELINLGSALSDPLRHGDSDRLSFDVVIPSLPGFVFSPPSASSGTNVFTIAGQWGELMDALGYRRFLAHGGDIGAGVSTALGLYHSDRVLGLHLHYIPGSYAPHVVHSSDLSNEERDFLVRRAAWMEQEGGYSHVQATKPDVLGPPLNDSAIGLAAWIVDKYRSWSDCDGDVENRFSRDELLTVVSLYWFTRSMPSAIRLYWEGRKRPLAFAEGDRVRVPVAVAHFPKELPIPPRSYVARGYNVTRWTEFPRGGHFAAVEETAALATDIREFTKSLYAR